MSDAPRDAADPPEQPTSDPGWRGRTAAPVAPAEQPQAKTPKPEAVKSRAIGVCLIVGGGVMIGLIPVLNVMSAKLHAMLLGFGTAGIMMGFGMIVVPWTDEMFAVNDTEDFGAFFGAMSRFWKVWFLLTIVVMLGVVLASLILN